MGGCAAYFGKKRREPRVEGQGLCDFLYSVDNCGMITMSQQKADLLEGQSGVLPEQEHRGVTCLGDRSCPALTGQGLKWDAVLIGYRLKYSVWLGGLGGGGLKCSKRSHGNLHRYQRGAD